MHSPIGWSHSLAIERTFFQLVTFIPFPENKIERPILVTFRLSTTSRHVLDANYRATENDFTTQCTYSRLRIWIRTQSSAYNTFQGLNNGFLRSWARRNPSRPSQSLSSSRCADCTQTSRCCIEVRNEQARVLVLWPLTMNPVRRGDRNLKWD